MNITKAHGEYWLARKAPWFLRDIYREKQSQFSSPPVSVHQLINAQLPIDRNSTAYKKGNTLSLCRSWRRRGEMIKEMTRLAVSNGDHNKHHVHCRRWLKKMNINVPRCSDFLTPEEFTKVMERPDGSLR